jgi:hypothetical protein
LKEGDMWVDILRLAVTFGAVVLIVAFWYWVMDNTGSF